MSHEISILTPFYNRPEFVPMMVHNIINQSYPLKNLEWVIIDDGIKPISESPMFKVLKDIISPVKLNYIRLDKKMILGEKRNMLIKKASHNICINMDDDDLYFPEYIEYSVKQLLDNKFTLVGSIQMLIINPYDNMKISAITGQTKRQIHEATMCFTKKHFKATGGFKNVQCGEGSNMVDNYNQNKIGLTDIAHLMICVNHKSNTINKDIFNDKYVLDEETVKKLPDTMKDKINILNDILK
jgi:glycosyltransferase involved in cell wall biosynthesis